MYWPYLPYENVRSRKLPLPIGPGARRKPCTWAQLYAVPQGIVVGGPTVGDRTAIIPALCCRIYAGTRIWVSEKAPSRQFVNRVSAGGDTKSLFGKGEG